ncbi:hypothetical protein [Pantoea sp. 1.19]|uniref:hypothetical protein n=1 Tax=Pantoea sp. 1.19 TaxID=1925589 RepID=UPI0009491C83|nr:hypothetical protein [Pantoea sp. 1.19]
MSVKSQFLHKLQARQPAPVPPAEKTQADIAAFRQRMAQLQAQMDAWLTETGLCVEAFSVSVTDLLVEGGAFEMTGLLLRVDDRTITFTPVFLYAQGITGCVEAAGHAQGRVTSLGRLVMCSGRENDWTFTPPGALSRPGQRVDESTFFGLLMALVP